MYKVLHDMSRISVIKNTYHISHTITITLHPNVTTEKTSKYENVSSKNILFPLFSKIP